MINVLKYPHEALLQKSSTWERNDTIAGYDDIEKFENDMSDVMQKSNGIGLAANQIGITKRFFCIGADAFDTFNKPVIIWNPQILKSSEEKVIDVEGCLSFPGVWVKVERPKIVEVMYETTDGKTRFARLDGFESKCYQHEYDHIEGITFNQRVSKLRWDMAKKG